VSETAKGVGMSIIYKIVYKNMSKTMIERILVLVIILVLTTFLFFILRGNRKSYEGMTGGLQPVIISGVEITIDTPQHILQEAQDEQLGERTETEKKIESLKSDIKKNDKEKARLVKEKRIYQAEIEKNRIIIDADNIDIETAKTNNQIFTADNERLEKNIDELIDKISDLKVEGKNIEQSNAATRKARRNKERNARVIQNKITRAETGVVNKNTQILSNEEQMVDITYIQTRIESLLQTELELTNKLVENRTEMASYSNSNQEKKGQIILLREDLRNINNNITYLGAAMQPRTQTQNPGIGSIALSSTGSGKT
jgi:chromosome segregation ATPase